jgi:hypothetical protein
MDVDGQKIVIEFDLGSLVAGREESGETFGDVIVNRAASVLLDRERESVGKFRALVAVIAESEVRDAIRPMIDQALAEPIQKTNTYGGPIGEAMPLREHIVEIARAALDTQVGRDYDKKTSLLRAILAEEVERVLRRELGEALAAAKAEVTAAVREQGAAVITETITRLARV